MSGLFKPKVLEAPKMPAIAPPTPLPDPADPAVTQARKKAVAQGAASQGVQSTILTAGGRETLGA